MPAICLSGGTEEDKKEIGSPFENTQGRLRSFDFAQDDGDRDEVPHPF
jgi:hypothetical protein